MSAKTRVCSHCGVLGLNTSTRALSGDTIQSPTDGDVSMLRDMSLSARPSPGYLPGTGSDCWGSQGAHCTLHRAGPEAAVSTPQWSGAL